MEGRPGECDDVFWLMLCRGLLAAAVWFRVLFVFEQPAQELTKQGDIYRAQQRRTVRDRKKAPTRFV